MDSIRFIDQIALQLLASIRTPGWTTFFTWVTTLGDTLIIAGILTAALLTCSLYRRYADSAGLLAAFFGSIIVANLLKLAFDRARPDDVYRLYAETSFAFPSAHAAGAAGLLGFFALLALQRNTNRVIRILAILGASIGIFLESFSRVYLGEHYVSDVIAGILIGILFAGVGRLVAKKLSKQS